MRAGGFSVKHGSVAGRIDFMRRALSALLMLAAAGVASPAQAHPHVWITAKAEILYKDDKVSTVRHVWTFDPGYSAYVTSGPRRQSDA